MATLIVGLVVGALAVWLWRRVAGWRPVRRRRVECCWCGEPLPVNRAVIVHGEVQAHQGLGWSTTVAEYHRRCARKAGVSPKP